MLTQSNAQLKPVALEKAYRLLNVGGTGLISAEYAGDYDLMPATWVGALDLFPCKATAVIDKSHYTRGLIEQSGLFAISLPTLANIEQMMYLGSVSKHDQKDKVERSGAELFTLGDFKLPLMRKCAAYMIFRLIPEEHNQKTYDLFIGEALAAWADERVFRDGHWLFEEAPEELSTVHYVAGNHFYTIGKAYDTRLSL
ncbi:MAG: flavin reductase family protein [Succinivibrio sp.]|nr:flavin reductase family protein [Succinivibrio sp.]